jgi:hypothetical protein
LPNICGAIDGIHIPLAGRPSKKYILVVSDYYNRKKMHSIVVKVI